MIDYYTMFIISCTIVFLIGTGQIIKDILLDYLYSGAEEYEEYIDTEYEKNMPCDNTGLCSNTCPMQYLTQAGSYTAYTDTGRQEARQGRRKKKL